MLIRRKDKRKKNEGEKRTPTENPRFLNIFKGVLYRLSARRTYNKD
jgi:hypothetical protein